MYISIIVCNDFIGERFPMWWFILSFKHILINFFLVFTYFDFVVILLYFLFEELLEISYYFFVFLLWLEHLLNFSRLFIFTFDLRWRLVLVFITSLSDEHWFLRILNLIFLLVAQQVFVHAFTIMKTILPLCANR